MKKVFMVWSILFFTGVMFAQSDAVIPPTSVATTSDVFSLQSNPAGLGINDGFQIGLVGVANKALSDLGSYYISVGSEGGGSGFAIHKFGDIYRYRYATSVELTRGSYLGAGIDFGKDMLPEYLIGLTIRPARFVSLGGAIFNLNQNNSRDADIRAGLGLRPFGERFTLSGDVIYNYNMIHDDYDTNWEVLLSARIVDGVTLKGFYNQSVNPVNSDEKFNTIGIGVGINLKHQSIEGASEVSGDDGAYANGVYAYHYSSASRHSIFSPIKPTKFVMMEIEGPLLEDKGPFSFLGRPKGRTITDLILELKNYSEQNDIAGVVLYLKNPVGGPAQFQEFRQALQRFQETGKKVYVYMDGAGNMQYYLASVADKVLLNPAGNVWLTGLSAQLMYVKNLLGKLGIKAEVVHIGKYKSAFDMYTRDTTTTANAEQINAYLDDLYEMMTRDIALSRDINQDSLKALIDRGPFVAKTALERGLVDSLMYHDELTKFVEKRTFGGKYNMISERMYNQQGHWGYQWKPPVTDKIAVIYAVGAIVPGKSQRSPFTGSLSMGSETIAKAIKSARKDNRVKAIVMRINSPGGSSLASDIIWREVYLTTTGKNAKPFIVSMGDVAGSGGYYIAVAADTILADESSLTGSIGVIAGSFSLEGLFSKISVNTDTFKRGEHSNFLSADHNMSEEERQKLLDLISDTYGIFVNKAAEGRGLDPDSIDALGRGRIYSGTDAESVGLVDKVAGLHQALNIAQRAAGIPLEQEVALEYYPKYQLNLLELFGGTDILVQKLKLSDEVQQKLAQLEQLNVLSTNQDVYYLLPYLLEMSN